RGRKSSRATFSIATFIRSERNKPCARSLWTFCSRSLLNSSLLFVGALGGGTCQPYICRASLLSSQYCDWRLCRAHLCGYSLPIAGGRAVVHVHSRVDRSDCHRAKLERNRLTVHVLRRMPHFHVEVAYASRAVF